MAKRTHGECWYLKKKKVQSGEILEIRSNFDKGCPNRMGRSAARKHYNQKCKDYFDSKLTIKDFDTVEDYFSFFEAKKFLTKIK